MTTVVENIKAETNHLKIGNMKTVSSGETMKLGMADHIWGGKLLHKLEIAIKENN